MVIDYFLDSQEKTLKIQDIIGVLSAIAIKSALGTKKIETVQKKSPVFLRGKQPHTFLKVKSMPITPYFSSSDNAFIQFSDS